MTHATPPVLRALPRPRVGPASAHALTVQAVIAGERKARMVFQPLVDLQRGRVVGYEALARFGARLSTSPTPWLRAAAHLRRAPELEAHLVQQALAARPTLPRNCFLAINVSPELLASAPLQRAFATVPDLNGVVVELTEHVEFADKQALLRTLDDLRGRGAQLALDDVGAGWAGLKQVADLRPDIVKLDRSLVTVADRDEVKQALAEMMLSLCSRLGATLLVEGVETHAELDLFARLGVPLGQGWVFGRPAAMPPGLDDDIAVRLTFLAGMSRHVDKVAAYVDVTAATCTAGAAVVDPTGPTVVLDTERRPVALLLADGRAQPVTTIVATESLRLVLMRAMTRPEAVRFCPLVCVDKAGRHVGVVFVEALALALARSESPELTICLPR